MSDETDRPPRPGLPDIPALLRKVIENFIDLGSARVQLAQVQLQEELGKKIRRLLLVVVPALLLLMAFGLVNVAIVAWFARSMGLIGGAFLLAGIYAVLGLAGLLWFRATGGMSPPDAGKGR
jgi:uncharacterized membrane protein YqjE